MSCVYDHAHFDYNEREVMMMQHTWILEFQLQKIIECYRVFYFWHEQFLYRLMIGFREQDT